MKHFFLIASFLLFFCPNSSAQYSIPVGSYDFLEVTAPAGYVRSANWSWDGAYLTLTDKSEVGAIVQVTHYFEGAAYVKCSYVYEYLGTYDHYYHAGTGTKTFRITCIGGKATISETNVQLKPGQKHRLKCTKSDNFGTPTWSSSNEDVATIDKNGNVTAITGGTVRITLDPIIAAPLYCDITVQKVDPTSIKLTPNPLTVVVGKQKQVIPTYQPNGASADVSWTSENENIATVSNIGFVKGVAEGVTHVVAKTDKGLTDKVEVIVVGAPTAVTLPDNIKLSEGYYYTFSPTLTPANSETTYKWKSSDTSVATISTSGRLYAKKAGLVDITVTTDNGISAKATVTVVAPEKGADKATMDYRGKLVDNIINNLKLDNYE